MFWATGLAALRAHLSNPNASYLANISTHTPDAWCGQEIRLQNGKHA
jgi:hypothetical protein